MKAPTLGYLEEQVPGPRWGCRQMQLYPRVEVSLALLS